jgi:hypothetical protein
MPDTPTTKSATVTQAPGPGRGPTEPVASESALGRRGRHRKPRPHRALLTVGGLALAAGALSLLRLGSAPSGEGGGVEAMDIEPSVAGSAESTAQDNAATAVSGAPTAGASPSATTTVGRGGTTPASGQAGQTGEAGKAGKARKAGEPRQEQAGRAGQAGQAAPSGTRPATAPPGAARGPRPIATTPPAETRPTRQPAPRPPAATPPKPAPNPKPPGLCVPIVGLCLDEGW